jgi:O-antigen/teichoic acid export membrane protein
VTKKIISTFGAKILVAVINLFLVVLLSQQIGASGRGEASLIITSIAFINIACNLIGGATLVYLVPRKNLFKLLTISYSWSLLVCCASYFLLLSLNVINPQYILHIAVLSFIHSIGSIHLTTLLGKERIMSNNLLTLLQSVIGIGVLAVFFFFLNRINVESYVFSLYMAFSSIAVLSFLFLIREIKEVSFSGIFSIFKEAAKIGFYNQAGHIMQFLNLRISFYLLNQYSGEATVGIYSNGVSIAESIWLISNSMAMVQYARIANSDNPEESRQLTLNLTKISLLVCTLAIIPFVLLPAEFFTFVFGGEFAEVKTAILLLAPGVVVYNLLLIMGHYFSGTGRYHINTLGSLAGLCVTVVLTFAVAPQYGLMEAGIIASCSYSVTAIFVAWAFFRESGYSIKKLIPDIDDYRYLKLNVKHAIKRFQP